MNLRQYIKKLLDEGKRSTDPEFEHLFTACGKAKVVALAKEILREKKLGEKG